MRAGAAPDQLEPGNGRRAAAAVLEEELRLRPILIRAQCIKFSLILDLVHHNPCILEMLN